MINIDYVNKSQLYDTLKKNLIFKNQNIISTHLKTAKLVPRLLLANVFRLHSSPEPDGLRIEAVEWLRSVWLNIKDTSLLVPIDCSALTLYLPATKETKTL